MDPFTIATGVVGLAQGLLELVSKNRKRAKQLAADMCDTVETIQAFHLKYGHLFVENQDLQKRITDLRASLTEIVEKCKEMVPQPEKHVFWKQMAGFRAWLKRGELEDRLAELNARAQQCQTKFMTLSTLSTDLTTREIHAMTARVDANISSIHQHIVVRRVSRDSRGRERSPLRRVELAGNDIVLGSSAGILKSPVPQPNDDDVKHAFLRLQAKDIDKLLSGLLQNPSITFRIPSPQPDDPTHAQTGLQLDISWETVQHYTALESTQLIDAIRKADASTVAVQIGDTLTYLADRYDHLGMHHEAVMLSALAIKFGRLSLEVYPNSDRLRTGLAIDLESYAILLSVREESSVEATQCMMEAVSIRRQLVAEHPLPGPRISLAHALLESSWLARWTGDLETAELHSSEALEIMLDVMGAAPGTIADENATQFMDWSGVEEDGVLVVDEWQAQGTLVYATVLKERLECALANDFFPDAYKYASASRSVYQRIANRHPQSCLSTLLEITTELLEDWAEPFRSDAETIALYADAIKYMSAIPSWGGESEADTLFEKYTLQAKMAFRLYQVDDPSAIEEQTKALLYWDLYYSEYIKSRQQAPTYLTAMDLAKTFHEQVQLYRASHQHQHSPLVDRRSSTILSEVDHPIRRQAKDMEQWLRDVYTATLSSRRGGADSEDTLRYGAWMETQIAAFSTHLGDFDVALQVVRRVIDASSDIIASHSFPPSAEDGRNIEWRVVTQWAKTAALILWRCLELVNDPRSLTSTEDVVLLVKSLFPTKEVICVPLDIDAEELLDDIALVLSIHSRHLETLRQTDKSLSVSRSNLAWYTARVPPSVHPGPRQYIDLVMDLVHNLTYAGQWTAALTYTTSIVHTLVSDSSSWISDASIFALLDHCSILTELGRVQDAMECVEEATKVLMGADDWDKYPWKEGVFSRKAMIGSLLGKGVAEQVEKLDFSTANDFDVFLDASFVFADMGDHQQASKHAQQAFSTIERLTVDEFNQWRYVRLMQPRTDSTIALAVAFILGGHIQDAAELFPPLFDIYKKELQYQRNLYPGYAVALRLAGWVYDKVGRVEEGKKMKKKEAGLEYLFDEEADEETLRVIRIRLEREERRPAIRRVREILGVEPYQPEPASK